MKEIDNGFSGEKESKERSLALLEAPSVFTVDSSTFLDYLFQEYPESKEFSPQIDLGWLTPAIDYLYQQKTPVDFYSGELRRLLEKFKLSEAKRQVPAERSVVFYYDSDTGNYQITPAFHGKTTSVQSEIAKIGQSGKWPLIEIHTHPFDSLPTPQDYCVLVQDSGTPERFINAIMVLCPRIQLLALATPQTPSLSVRELDLFLNQFQTDIEPDPRMTILKQQQEAIISKHLKWTENSLARLERSLTKATGDSGEIPPETLHGIKQAFWEQVDLMAEEFERKLTSNQSKLTNYSERVLNTALLRVARLWNIQLYFSTDRNNFIKFSA